MKTTTIGLFLCVSMLFSCKEDPGKSGVQVQNLFPKGGPSGTLVTLHGKMFGKVKEDLEIKFNGSDIPATIVSVTETEITLQVPPNAASGWHTLKRRGYIENSFGFSILPAPLPYITKISPESGKVGDIITIHGKYFATSKAQHRLSFHDSTSATGALLDLRPEESPSAPFSEIVFATTDSVGVRIPPRVGTGYIMMYMDYTDTGTFTNYFTISTPVVTIVK
ncbi:IPT/TIG domain-containing protein [Xanthocytophaga agilis]|uniref:IPT/TIG domain-containing protein n=1 Tax=Xanthocytophaga agilis TaxID=3048010 RepID=A0AAE3RCZ4_9BACT|nr:IPT/TIG domain-containing protein [Xanthocytophaga agilis]MDJ1506277.1 IPT/TIG domain-containing protein [Xanthocytophaga agilis]